MIKTIRQYYSGRKEFNEYAKENKLGRYKEQTSVNQKPEGTYTSKAKKESEEAQRYAGEAVKASGANKPRPTINTLSRRQYPNAKYRPNIGFFR